MVARIPVSIGRLDVPQNALKDSYEHHQKTIQNTLSDGMIGPYSERDAAIIPMEVQLQRLESQLDNNQAIEHILRPMASQLQSVQNLHQRIYTEAINMSDTSKAQYYNLSKEVIDSTLDELTSVLNQRNIDANYSMSGTAADQASVVNLKNLADLGVGGTTATTDYYTGGNSGGTIYIDGEGSQVEKNPITAAHEGIRSFVEALLKFRGSNTATVASRNTVFSEIIGALETSSKQLGIAMSQVSVPLHHVGEVNQRLEREKIAANTSLGTMQAQSSIEGMMDLNQQKIVQDIARSLLQQKASGINQMVAILQRI